MPIDPATCLANVERARAEIARPPEIMRLDGETVYHFGEILTLRIFHQDRRFFLLDHGIHRRTRENGCAVDDSAPSRDVSNGKVMCWPHSLAWDDSDPDLEADDDDEWLDSDDPLVETELLCESDPEAEMVRYWESLWRLRNAQVRVVRRVLLSELPREIGQWVVRMRFRWLTFADVRLLWKHFEEATVIASGNLKLLPIWLATGVDMVAPKDWDEYWTPGTLDPCSTRWLRVRLAQMKLRPRAWRLLCRYGARLWPPCLYSHDSFPDKREQCDKVLHYLRVLTADDGYLPMSPEEKKHIWELIESRGMRILAIPGLARTVIQEIRRRYKRGEDLEMRNAVDWLLAREASNEGATNSADWAWWLKQYPRLMASMSKTNTESDPISWAPLVDAYRHGKFDIVPLSNDSALRLEGRRMRNCAAEYVDECLYDRLRMFSVRDTASGRSVATVAVEFDPRGTAHIKEAKGFANGEIPKDVEPLLDELRRRCEVACERMPSETDDSGLQQLDLKRCSQSECPFNKRCRDVVCDPEMTKPENLARLRRLGLFCLLRVL